MAIVNTTTCIVDGPPVATTACIVGWGPVIPAHTNYHFTPRLSDEDVDRIARRVVELQRQGKP